ncbi:nuclear protein [Cryptococcus gattii E566]|uniref:Nucleus protein, putative n=2 Tax=Cryptococcus gattii TaxID=37769 RepID=E6QXL8_CRYGW|nr:nucleus protein, putative [Cryptococcus gattii WM276]ADV19672.1 nucleus protein, putative [Cryptococcus gattii WM276]KIR79791.1 nuclear protein [Cryptococcus gattii EJB2]KIY36986.1 nuclear protein [Cryptococcus gattii E566]KJE02706.1 nuclear protein [Cryptococcus gattii NT-10]
MPAAVRERSPSSPSGRATKKSRNNTEHAVLSSINHPSAEQVAAYREKYVNAAPFKHAVLSDLLSDDLLEGVVEESKKFGMRGEEGSLPGWGWEQKETDIYKIQQTPDLSSLSPEHLPDETLEALPLLTRLKDALYSQEFRNLVRQVTGCGPLSGTKTDLSAALYSKGSHLLLHDDSISTRLISYILYLPYSIEDAPESKNVALQRSANGKFLKGWDPAWGGSLELFPVENGEEVGPPSVKRFAKVSATWGQIVFFEVQPGRSYHSVEEVVIDEGRRRFSVSGWFHRPVEGEEGYAPIDKEKEQMQLSSLAQITATPSAPFTSYNAAPPAGLKPSDIAFLSNYLSPSYLTAATLERLSGQFVEASEIVLHNFLQPELATKLKAETEGVDKKDQASFEGVIPPQELGEGDGWIIQGPSSKHRYLSLTSLTTSTPIVQSIHNVLFPSEAFRAWLSVVSSLAPTGHRNEARRFRNGLDYTLANGEGKDGDARLDVSLGMTWWADVPAGSDQEDALVENGGWEAYLAAPDEDEDPTVYQSSMAKKAVKEHSQEPKESNGKKSEEPKPHANGSNEKKDGPSISIGGQELEFDPDQFSPSDFDSDSEVDDEDDGPLLTQPVAFNRLLLVLRDPGVMKFVKYLGANAPGSRWDVTGEFEVGVLEEEPAEEGAPEAEGSGEVKADA